MTEYRRLLRMDEECFNFLLEALRPDITYRDTNRRKAVTPEQRLSTFLHFVATGKLKKLRTETAFAFGNAFGIAFGNAKQCKRTKNSPNMFSRFYV